MSLSDCPKCWDTPCTCGHEYEDWSVQRLRHQVTLLQSILDRRSSSPSSPTPAVGRSVQFSTVKRNLLLQRVAAFLDQEKSRLFAQANAGHSEGSAVGAQAGPEETLFAGGTQSRPVSLKEVDEAYDVLATRATDSAFTSADNLALEELARRTGCTPVVEHFARIEGILDFVGVPYEGSLDNLRAHLRIGVSVRQESAGNVCQASEAAVLQLRVEPMLSAVGRAGLAYISGKLQFNLYWCKDSDDLTTDELQAQTQVLVAGPFEKVHRIAFQTITILDHTVG